MTFTPVNQRATVVVLGYSFNNTFEFLNILKRKGLYTKFQLEDGDQSFLIGDDIPNREEVIKNIKNNLIINFKNSQNTVGITFSALQQRLDIVNNVFNSNDFVDFKNIIEKLIDLKVSDISTIGINFSADFELSNIRLKLLNEEIQKIKDFDKNVTFQLILPIKYDDYVATYKVQKLVDVDPIVDENEENRTYQVDVNFNIDLSKMGSREKIQKVDNLLDNLKTNFYSAFNEKCQEFLSLHYE